MALGFLFPFKIFGEPTPARARCGLGFPELVRRSHPKLRLHWKSRLLTGEKLAGVSDPAGRLLGIINDVADSKSSLAKQVGKELATMGAVHSSQFWDRFIASEDLLLSFTEAYRGLLKRVEESLPRDGSTILDLASGAGNFPLYALMKCPGRKLVLTDFSRAALEISARKLQGLVEEDGLDAHRFIHASVLSPRLSGMHADAVMMVNSLHLISDKKRALARVQDNLKWGGLFLLVEPTARLRSLEKAKKFLLDLGLSAVENHSPLTDFDFALVVAAYLRKLTRSRFPEPGPSVLSPAELGGLLDESGFALQSNEVVFDGAARLFVSYRK